MLFVFAFGVNEDVIKVHYYNNIELLCQDLINIALKRGRYIGQSKKHHLVLEMAMVASEGCFLFIAFPNPHSMIDVGEVELDETSSLT